ncbi:terminase TerL endonuclease subunit [Singulisphaera sp. GP187]|uniref:terminase TerL endonuclease subunit n=1 Tax=Singulisphaera sp. GP187 TaxID=1882752 RepID=UPI0009407916|nr:terminase TerL endonuclease subunit [Singulisphaera sp. GP187]
MTGRSCYAGLDLGVTGDMAALARVFPNELGGLDLLPKFWVPKEGRWKHEKLNKERYPLWEQQGYLVFTEGEATDFNQVETDILELHESTPFRVLTADRAYATHLLTRLFNNHDMKVDGIPQGPVSLNEAMVRFESMMLDRTLRHENHAVLDWNIANATVKTTSTGLMHLVKSSSTKRIDGLAATINAIVGWLKDGGEGDDSIYDERGILFL